MVRTTIPSSSQLTASSYESQASLSQRHALTDSQYPSVAVQAFIDLLPGLGDDLHVVAGHVSIFDIDVPAIVTPNNQADPGAGNPGDPFRTHRQRHLFNTFKVAGREGLAKYLYEEYESELRTARDGTNPSTTWKTMLDDRNNGTYYVVIYLMMLPDCIIEVLIRGTLAYELKYNPEVARYKIYMKPRNIPGIYLNIVAHGKWLVPSSCGKDPDQGQWLSAIELEKLLQSYTAYIEDTDAAVNNAVYCQFKAKLVPEDGPKTKDKSVLAKNGSRRLGRSTVPTSVPPRCIRVTPVRRMKSGGQRTLKRGCCSIPIAPVPLISSAITMLKRVCWWQDVASPSHSRSVLSCFLSGSEIISCEHRRNPRITALRVVLVHGRLKLHLGWNLRHQPCSR